MFLMSSTSTEEQPVTYRVHKWGVRDWRVMRKPLTSLVSQTVSQHTTKSAAYAALRRVESEDVEIDAIETLDGQGRLNPVVYDIPTAREEN